MIQFTSDIKYDDFCIQLDFYMNENTEDKISEFEREMYELERRLNSIGVVVSDYVDITVKAEDLNATFRMAVRKEDAAKFASDFENFYTEAGSGFEAELSDGEQYIRFRKYDISYNTLNFKFCQNGMTLEAEKELPHYSFTELFNEVYRLKL